MERLCLDLIDVLRNMLLQPMSYFIVRSSIPAKASCLAVKDTFGDEISTPTSPIFCFDTCHVWCHLDQWFWEWSCEELGKSHGDDQNENVSVIWQGNRNQKWLCLSSDSLAELKKSRCPRFEQECRGKLKKFDRWDNVRAGENTYVIKIKPQGTCGWATTPRDQDIHQ